MHIILALARSTQTSVLCTLWGLSEPAVLLRKQGKRPLSFREAGALAAMAGVRTSDLLD